MEDFDNFHFNIKISYGRKNSNLACAVMIQIAIVFCVSTHKHQSCTNGFFALYDLQAFQCTHKPKFPYRMFCALRRNSNFGSIHTSDDRQTIDTCIPFVHALFFSLIDILSGGIFPFSIIGLIAETKSV